MVHTTKPKFKAGSLSFAVNGKPVSAQEFRKAVDDTFKMFRPLSAEEIEWVPDEKHEGMLKMRVKKKLM